MPCPSEVWLAVAKPYPTTDEPGDKGQLHGRAGIQGLRGRRPCGSETAGLPQHKIRSPRPGGQLNRLILIEATDPSESVQAAPTMPVTRLGSVEVRMVRHCAKTYPKNSRLMRFYKAHHSFGIGFKKDGSGSADE